jgi:hypothetical protein
MSKYNGAIVKEVHQRYLCRLKQEKERRRLEIIRSGEKIPEELQHYPDGDVELYPSQEPGCEMDQRFIRFLPKTNQERPTLRRSENSAYQDSLSRAMSNLKDLGLEELIPSGDI